MKKSDSNFAPAMAQVVEMKLAGKGWKEILQATGLNHCQADLAWYRHQAEEANEVIEVEFATWDLAKQAAAILKMREAGLSWGKISVRVGLVEATVRNTFEAKCGLASSGLRIGKGGRWLEGEQAFYVGNHKGYGLEFDKGTDPRALEIDPEDASVLKARVAAALKTKAVAKARKAKATQATTEEVTA